MIYGGDTNYWDSNILDNDRDLFACVNFGGTDFYPSKDYNLYWWYDIYWRDFQTINNMHQSNTSFFNDTINGVGPINKQDLLFSSALYVSKQNSMDVDFNNWNGDNSLYFLLECETDNAYLDDACLQIWNKNDTPFGTTIARENYVNGYDTGYQASLNDNQDQIYQKGYDEGETKGYKDGYQEGYKNSRNDNKAKYYNQGYDAGYNVGVDYGYEQGYQEGLQDEDNNMLSHAMIVATDTPIRIFKQAFDFEVLGINIAGVSMAFVALLLTIFLIKKLL